MCKDVINFLKYCIHWSTLRGEFYNIDGEFKQIVTKIKHFVPLLFNKIYNVTW